ncbi:hypothetical protein GCM10010517_59760 [Streptosporangium fragile]|uniref:Uncharacterized protein n=1 Tax=Streptosporangium fragile TaxID=46186 RepID=A0ABN3W599_9ACTN
MIPVRSVNGRVFAAMAAVGAVFSEMKFKVAPWNWRHWSSLAVHGASLREPHALRLPPRASDAPAARAPRRTSRLLGWDELRSTVHCTS